MASHGAPAQVGRFLRGQQSRALGVPYIGKDLEVGLMQRLGRLITNSSQVVLFGILVTRVRNSLGMRAEG